MKNGRSLRQKHGTMTSKVAYRGFSLVELILIMGAIALIAIAIFIIFNSVQTRTQVEFEGRRLTGIVSGVHSWFAGHFVYRGLTTGVANQARVFPANMNGGDFTPSAPIVNLWGGAVTLAPEGSPATRFVIRYENVPTSACVGWLPASAPLFAQVRVGPSGTIVHDVTPTGTPATSQLDVEAAVQACASAPAVPIEWVSY